MGVARLFLPGLSDPAPSDLEPEKLLILSQV